LETTTDVPERAQPSPDVGGIAVGDAVVGAEDGGALVDVLPWPAIEQVKEDTKTLQAASLYTSTIRLVAPLTDVTGAVAWPPATGSRSK